MADETILRLFPPLRNAWGVEGEDRDQAAIAEAQRELQDAIEATSLSLIANFVLFTNLAGLIFRIVSLRDPSFSIRRIDNGRVTERIVLK